MDCSSAIEYIHSLNRFGIKPGLERIAGLCALLGNPQNDVKFIHVAGTNGKGSTSTMISNMLVSAGYRVGLFTSPYVVDFRERIQLDGKMIEPDELALAVSEVKKAADTLAEQGIFVTEFEAITAAAFLFFARSRVDVAVLEVGLGGRFDSTNVISTPVVSVLTSISMDHMDILGDTIEKIAGEKCGIIKPNGVCVSYPEQFPEAFSVIEKSCEEQSDRLIVPDCQSVKVVSSDIFGTVFTYGNLEISIPLTGIHMVKNAVTAIETVRNAEGFSVSDEAIVKGIADSRMPARLEIIRKSPLTIIDGGHNEGCAEALSAYIDRYLSGRRIVALCAMMADKDCSAYLELVASKVDVFVASKASVPRSHTAEDLCEIAKPFCSNLYWSDDPDTALDYAKKMCGENDVLLVCGSFYFASDVREKL